MLKRGELASKYLRGFGIEIGALHCPTPVAADANVKYVDRAPEEMKANHGDVFDRARLPDIIDDAETLATIESSSQAFLIANHVLEHLEDPLTGLTNWLRVVASDGILMVALPNKDHCFDRPRPVTPFQHVVDDGSFGPERSRYEHYVDWFKNAETTQLRGEELANAVESAFAARANIHFHVWDFEAMCELFGRLAKPLRFSILDVAIDGGEVVWILKKR